MIANSSSAPHEAAHAAAALLLGLPVLSVSVQPDDRTDGRVRVLYRNTPEDAEKRVTVILCGLSESDAVPGMAASGGSHDR